MTLKETIAMVEDFHNAFGIENRQTPTAELSESQRELRYRLMAEENDEYLEAVKNNDLVEIADALCDQLYILCGTILKHGLQDKPEWNHFMKLFNIIDVKDSGIIVSYIII